METIAPEEIEAFLQEIESVNPTLTFKGYNNHVFTYEGTVPFGQFEGSKIMVTGGDADGSYSPEETFLNVAAFGSGDFVKLTPTSGELIQFFIP